MKGLSSLALSSFGVKLRSASDFLGAGLEDDLKASGLRER